jgi:hypothetical protein
MFPNTERRRRRVKLSQEDAGGPRDEAGKWHHGGMTPPKDCEREQTFEAEECAACSTTLTKNGGGVMK